MGRLEKLEKKSVFKTYWLPLVVALIFTLLACLTFWQGWKAYKDSTNQIIVYDIDQLSQIFDRIQTEVGILDFEHQKNYIDFLNVEKFSGSEVGAMNLIHPEKWAGPYLPSNPTVQEKFYQIVRAKQGHFIVPGEGVKISSGKVIGKDIIFDEDADIEKMLQSELLFEEKPLAAKIKVGR